MIKPGVRQFQTQEILPIKTGADGLSRLSIREVLAKLHHRHQGKAPRRHARLATGWKEPGRLHFLSAWAGLTSQPFRGILTAGRRVILPCHYLRGALALGWLLGYYQLCYALRMPGAPSSRSGSGQTAACTVGEKHGNRRHPDVSRPKRNC